MSDKTYEKEGSIFYRSAPDLLDALHECADYLDKFADAEFTQDGPNPNEAMVLLTTVKRAISKAEGR